jgi:hypothetical protein
MKKNEKSWDLVTTRKKCCKTEFLLSMLEYVRVWRITWCQVLCVVLPHGKLQSYIDAHQYVTTTWQIWGKMTWHGLFKALWDSMGGHAFLLP